MSKSRNFSLRYCALRFGLVCDGDKDRRDGILNEAVVDESGTDGVMRARFDYARPATAQEAIKLKSQLGEKARYWAGGTDMTLLWQRSEIQFDHCIDIRQLDELDYISVEPDSIRIGAMASLSLLERSAEAHHLLATLSDITKLMCTPQTRTLATVGGNLCNASPASDLSPAFVAMNAQVVILGEDGERSVGMFEFFEGVNKTALRGTELLKEVTIPLPSAGQIAASYRRIDRTVVDIALVNAASALTVSDSGEIKKASIALGAVAPVIVRSEAAAQPLIGRTLDELDDAMLAAAGEAASKDAKPISDVRASAGYRRDMVKVMVRRSLADCVEQLKG